MTRRRGSHQQKTVVERQRYFETTIRGKPTPTPTVDDFGQEVDSTETTLAEGPELLPSYRRTKAPNPHFVLLRENWIKVVAVVVLIPLTGWVLIQLYTLNREVGELHIQMSGTTTEQDKLGKELDRLGEEMRQEIDRINDRLDRANKGP